VVSPRNTPKSTPTTMTTRKTPTTTRSVRRRSASVAKKKRRSVANIADTVTKTRMTMLTSVAQVNIVATVPAPAPANRNTIATRRARAPALNATRVATARSSDTVKRRVVVMEDARNKRGMDLDVRSTAARLEATADSNRSMALTLIALVDMVAVARKNHRAMAVVRKNLHPATDASKSTFRNLAVTASRAMDARSHVSNLQLVTVLTPTTAPVPDMAAKSARSMVVKGPVSRMVRRVCLGALERRRRGNIVVVGGGRMRMSMGGLLGGRRVEGGMEMRGMRGGTRRGVVVP
jgi:hypothetical protein